VRAWGELELRVHELHDRLIEIRRVLDDLGAVTTELSAIRGRKEAQRILTDLLEEIQELPDALARRDRLAGR
jgi:hypothetical protein